MFRNRGDRRIARKNVRAHIVFFDDSGVRADQRILDNSRHFLACRFGAGFRGERSEIRANRKQDLTAGNPARVRWLWHGYLAPGATTLLTGPWKAGKTTLLAALLARLGTGGTLAGLPVIPGRALVVSEESRELWAQRGEQFDFGRHVCWLCRPFTHKPNTKEWEDLIARLVGLGTEHDLTLVVIDPLIAFLPGRDENSAAAIMAALLPLRRLTAAGIAVLLLHHPRKGRAQDGQLSRGSGALSGHVDVLIEWNWCDNPAPKDRRRRLRAFSRFGESIPEQVIELDTAGTNYIAHGPSDALAVSWPGLDVVLTRTRHRMTRPEILADWPPEHERPSPNTLWRVLEQAGAAGRMKRDGTGTRADPFVYWLTGQEEVWQRDPLGLLNEPATFQSEGLTALSPGQRPGKADETRI